MNHPAGSMRMRALHEFPLAARSRVRAVLTDVDGTLTTGGRLHATTLAALERLHDAGLLVIAVTGGPAGWCDHMARTWPVHAVVGESGAFWFRRLPGNGRLERRFRLPEAEHAGVRARLRGIGERVLRGVAGTALAADQAYRELDLAIDWCENVDRLPPEKVQSVVDIVRGEGARAAVSSIHVNGWLGDYDKLSTSRRLLEEAFGIDAARERERLVYVGDAPNDCPLFGFFPNAVGVANVREFAGHLETEPAWVTPSACGAGFAEVADSLLAARAQT